MGQGLSDRERGNLQGNPSTRLQSSFTAHSMDIQENVALAPLTTLGVGGNARFFVRAASIEEAESALAFAQSNSLPVFVLGGGSNLLISDNGWPGLVLQVGILGIDESASSHFSVGAGENWDTFVAHAVAKECAGVECLSGIPGNVGGTPVQNVGAYGQEVSETIASVLVLDRSEGRVRKLTPQDCGFSYRSSIFNTSQRDRHIILRVTYALRPAGTPSLRYTDLQKHFADRTTPRLYDVRQGVLEIRAGKGMLIEPGDPDSRSAGSFFKNPMLSEEQYTELLQTAKQRNLSPPSYPALSQQKKISAAWLVESSGFAKGYIKGRAGISSKHALALINRGGATAADIVALKDQIQQRVEQTWGIRLEPEPVLVGF